MVMACRWVTIWRAHHNRKFMASQVRNFLMINHVLVLFQTFVVMVMVTADQWRRTYGFVECRYKLPELMAAVTLT